MTSDPDGFGPVFDAHADAECKTRGLEAAMVTMGANPHVSHVPPLFEHAQPQALALGLLRRGFRFARGFDSVFAADCAACGARGAGMRRGCLKKAHQP
jgi:hypothetical protein